MELPEAPEAEPEVVVPDRNPKLYQLVAMSEESSFWWDSVDANEETSELTLDMEKQLNDRFAAGFTFRDQG